MNWVTVLTSGVTCLLTLTITLIFNLFVNGTRKSMAKKQDDLISMIRGVVKEELVSLNTDIQLTKKGLQVILKNDLKIHYDEWLKKGYAPLDAKNDLERMYQVYHSLGANGVIDADREKFLNLPNSKPVKKKSTDKKEI